MFEQLCDYRNILVTGPQRSGTRICAQMVAHDTGHGYIDEVQIDTDSLYRLADAFSLNKVVVQCPACARFIHNFSNPHSLVIFM